MNALDFLKQEHDEHRRLFETAGVSGDEFETLRAELIHHVNIEETILFPRLKMIPLLRETVESAWKDHNEIMERIQELDAISDKLLREPLFKELKELHLAHIEEEEQVLFPRVRKLATEDYLIECGKQLLIQKNGPSEDDILYPEVPGSHEI